MTTLDDTSKMTGIPTCKFADRIQQRVKSNLSQSITPMILNLLFWSGELERTMLHTTKISIWTKTVTMCPS